MEEDEALRNYCRRMISVVQGKQQKCGSSGRERRRRKDRTTRGRKSIEGQRRAVEGETFSVVGTSPGTECCVGAQLVPVQLITRLRLKTVQGNMTRAAEVKLHDPTACAECEQEQASLALKGFIRRKKTQLQFQALKGRLNTHLGHEECAWRRDLCKISQSPSMMPLTGFGRNYSVDICRSQQPGVALETTKERGVALATDEMRGYPDKNATGTHLARPHCAFSDR